MLGLRKPSFRRPWSAPGRLGFLCGLLSLLGLGTAPAIAQPDVDYFTVTSRLGENVLEWKNPLVPFYASTRIIGRTDHFPTDANDTAGAFVVDVVGLAGADDTVPDSGLTGGLSYFYGAFVSDGAGFSSGRFVEGIPPPAGPIVWRFRPSTAAVSMTPPGVGAAVLFPNNDGNVYAVERGPSGGGWASGVSPAPVGIVQHRPPVITLSGVTTADRFALSSSQDGLVHAIDVDTGAILWSSQDLGALQAGPGAWFSAFGGGDFVLVGTRNDAVDNVFFALHAAGGGEAWRFDDPSGTKIGLVNGAPTIDYATSRVYFASLERSAGADTVWALDLATGAKIWSVPLGDVSGSPILRAGVLYVGADDGKIYGLHATDGSIKLNFPFDTHDGVTKGFVFPDFAGDRLYLSTENNVWCIRDVNPVANKRWSHPNIPGPSIVAYPPGSPYLWVGSSDGSLYQINVATGNPAQPPDFTSIVIGNGASGVGSPSIDVTFHLAYVGTEDGSLYAIQIPF